MVMIELAGGVPALHPERKGQLNKSPKKNWVEKRGGLPTYINSFATALKRENPSWTTSRAIAVAVNMAKKICSTGRAMNLKGKPKVSPAVRTAACGAVASWNAKKAGASEAVTEKEIIALSSKLTKEDVDDARINAYQKIGFTLSYDESEEGVKLEPNGRVDFSLSDEEYVQDILGFSDDIGEEVNELDANRYMELLEFSAAEQQSLRLPVYDLANDASESTDGLMEKEILRAGTINYKGRKVTFSEDDLAAAERNFYGNALDYVPFQLATDENSHSDSPKLYGGTLEKVRRSTDGKKLIGSFRLTDEVKRIVKHNPKFGVSVKLHPNYIRSSDEKEFGPTLLHVAGVHRPRITGMTPWQAIAASEIEDDPDTTINLADEGEYEEETIEQETTEPENNTEGGYEIMAGDGTTQTLTNEQLQEMIQTGMTAALAPLKEENESLKTQVQNMSENNSRDKENQYKSLVNGKITEYKTAGVPPAIADLAEELLLSFDKDARNVEIDLSEGETEDKVSRVELVTRLLDNAKGFVNLSDEEGSIEEAEFSDDDEASIDFLLNG